MTSMRSMAPAGRVLMYCFRASSFMWLGWSLIQISTLETPRKVMLPSASTSTPGAFCRASLRVPLCMLTSSLVLYMFFSPSMA